jgi:2'-5' RNA ligase
MGEVNCSVVAYLPGALGEFVDSLRTRLNPRFAHWRAHVTILPPRLLPPDSQGFLAEMQAKCQLIEPFEARLSEVATFWPVKGVVYLAVSIGSEQLSALHDLLNRGLAARAEPYAFVPHVTLAQELDEAEVRSALGVASEERARYADTASFQVEALSLVRQLEDKSWLDLASVALGTALKPARS